MTRQYSEDSVAGSESGVTRLSNQFSFTERASQTPVLAQHEVSLQTEPPARANFSQTASQWRIYDQYERYEARREKEEKNEVEEVIRTSRVPPVAPAKREKESEGERMLKSAKILERMVNLNTFDEIAQDFRFWEDASDEFKDVEGSLLPLWRFSLTEAKDLEVASLCWAPEYPDLFAISLGSYNFYQQPGDNKHDGNDDSNNDTNDDDDDNDETISPGRGYVCLFSLKNPSYPEWVCSSPCSVMSVDLHPAHPHMVVCGLYDGNVAVYNLHTKDHRRDID